MSNRYHRWAAKLTITSLIQLSFGLAIVGVLLALLSFMAPHWFDISYLQGAGSIAQAIASIFGITIASAALFAYLKREEVGQTQADLAFQQKLRLEQSIHQFCLMFQRLTQRAVPDKSGKLDLSHYVQQIRPAMVHLRTTLQEASGSDLYTALGSCDGVPSMDGRRKINGGTELVALHMLVVRMLDNNAIDLEDNTLLTSVVDLGEVLRKIRKDNIYELIHTALNMNPMNYVREWSMRSAPIQPRS